MVHNYAAAIAVSNDDETDIKKLYQKVYGWYMLGNALEGNLKLTPERLLKAANILVNNEHAEITKNNDTYKVTLRSTDSGEIAYNDGFYTTLIYSSIKKTVAVIVSIILGLASIVKWVIPLIL